MPPVEKSKKNSLSEKELPIMITVLFSCHLVKTSLQFCACLQGLRSRVFGRSEWGKIGWQSGSPLVWVVFFAAGLGFCDICPPPWVWRIMCGLCCSSIRQLSCCCFGHLIVPFFVSIYTYIQVTWGWKPSETKVDPFFHELHLAAQNPFIAYLSQ